MEPIKGSPIFVGHRAYGSLLSYILFLFLIVALALYLHFEYPSYLDYVIYTFHGFRITVLDVLIALFLIVLLIMYIRHRQWTYIITDRQIYVRRGIIASDARSFRQGTSGDLQAGSLCAVSPVLCPCPAYRIPSAI